MNKNLFAMVALVFVLLLSGCSSIPVTKSEQSIPTPSSTIKSSNVYAESALKRLGLTTSRNYPLEVVDAKAGKNFAIMAIYIHEINEDKMIVAIDRFRKQLDGSGFIIYFINSKDYSIDRRRELAHKVVAVYASTTKELQILNSKGEVVKVINGA